MMLYESGRGRASVWRPQSCVSAGLGDQVQHCRRLGSYMLVAVRDAAVPLTIFAAELLVTALAVHDGPDSKEQFEIPGLVNHYGQMPFGEHSKGIEIYAQPLGKLTQQGQLVRAGTSVRRGDLHAQLKNGMAIRQDGDFNKHPTERVTVRLVVGRW